MLTFVIKAQSSLSEGAGLEGRGQTNWIGEAWGTKSGRGLREDLEMSVPL